jgi:dihydrofolate reductase
MTVPELFADLFVSVDGSTLGTRSPGYFGYLGPDLERWISEEQARPRLHVMGRKTYETLAQLPQELRDEGWELSSRKPTVVFSRTLSHAAWPGVELSDHDAVDELRRRKAAGHSDLRTVGSLSLVQQLLDAGLVDHLRLMVFPLALGETGERPVFEQTADVGLTLEAHTVLDGRILLLDYRPDGRPPYADEALPGNGGDDESQ